MLERSVHVILICFVYHSNFVQLSMFKYFFLEKNHHLSEDFKIILQNPLISDHSFVIA